MPVVAGLALLALGCLVRLPHWWGLQGHEQVRQAGLQQAQQAKAASLAAVAQEQVALEAARLQVQEARWRLAAGAGMSDLLEQLASSGLAYGLHFEQVDVQDPVAREGYELTPLTVQVVGRYPALRMWLDDWLGQARLLQAEDLHLLAAKGEPGLLRLQLRVNAYQADTVLPAPTSLADVPARAEAQPPALDPFAAWAARLSPSGLAGVPLSQLEMVGSLQRGLEREALLSAKGRVYRVRAGDRVGRDGGVVEQVGERQMDVRERLFVGGVWRERTVMLTLRKSAFREASDGNDAAVDRLGGVDAAGMGAGGPLSG
nr:pilus assembly protein PilP [Pantoea sp. Ap-967]